VVGIEVTFGMSEEFLDIDKEVGPEDEVKSRALEDQSVCGQASQEICIPKIV
jgi:hypothetical protein